MKHADKLLHFGVCFIAALSTSVLMALCGERLWISVVISFSMGMSLGIGKECGDALNEYNRWSWGDIAADALGAAMGSLGALLAL